MSDSLQLLLHTAALSCDAMALLTAKAPGERMTRKCMENSVTASLRCGLLCSAPVKGSGLRYTLGIEDPHEVDKAGRMRRPEVRGGGRPTSWPESDSQRSSLGETRKQESCNGLVQLS